MTRDIDLKTTYNYPPRFVEIEVKTLDNQDEILEEGYYGETDLTEVEPNLAPENIKDGVTIFGIEGTYTGE